VTRWNRLIEKAGYSFRLALPSTRFRRSIGTWAGVPTDTTGKPITQEEFNVRIAGWLPSDSDQAFILSLMHGVYEQGKMAAWIAPPDRGINNNPVDYEYVQLH
jgi:benzoyl-CoA 2,3-epoxidase subunit B